MSVITVSLFFMLLCCSTSKGSTVCSEDKFQCDDGVQCIEKFDWCNGIIQCTDGSDEKFCKKSGYFTGNPNKCRSDHFKCDDGPCIPLAGKCDGFNSCEDNSDEKKCATGDPAEASLDDYESEVEILKPSITLDSISMPLARRLELAAMKAKQWLFTQMKDHTWGADTQRAIVALFLDNPKAFQKGAQKDYVLISKKLQSRLIIDLARNQLDLFDLASYIQALLATCQDPTAFHGYDLVTTLRQKTDANYHSDRMVSPFVYLTLCIAGRSTYNDLLKTWEYFQFLGVQLMKLDIQSIAALFSTCWVNIVNNSNSDAMSRALTIIASKWRGNEDVYITALYAQALYAADINKTFSMKTRDATERALSFQKDDGSFGDFLSTYYMMPVLSGRSLLSLSQGCKADKSTESERILLPNLQLPGSKIEVKYSLYLGKQSEVQHTIHVNVPDRTTLFELMNIASKKSPLFRFEYDLMNGKTRVFSFGTVPNDSEQGLYWIPYVGLNQTEFCSTENSLRQISDIGVYIPRNKDHLIFWYKRL